jgi:hypothetical protein
MNGLLSFAINLKNESDASESASIRNKTKYFKNILYKPLLII